ncbi:MAG: hypothetical protein AAF349_16530 [Cyanobacteria bacterium P01_A01_bin.68]
MSQFFTMIDTNARSQLLFNFADKLSEARGKNAPQIVHIDVIRKCPDASLGKALADFLDGNNLKPLTTGFRRKQLHDAVHVVAGYGSDPIGEAEVQAFLLGAKFSLPNVLIGLSLRRLIRRTLPNEFEIAKERMQKAYQRAKKSNFNPDTWEPELLWDLPLAEVRAKFGL